MKLKEFINETFEKNPFEAVSIVSKLIELQAIEQYLNVILGIELDIEVKPVKPLEGRFYGKSLIDIVNKSK
jgi:hypothetical protein